MEKNRFSILEIALWLVGLVLAIVLFLTFAPGFLGILTGATVPTVTPQPTVTPRPTWTSAPTLTGVPQPPSVIPSTPLPTPTLAASAKAFTFTLDLKRSGWFTDKETIIHWGDRNLHAGVYRDQIYQSILYFNALDIIPGSKIIFADIELVGLNRNNMSAKGAWNLRLLANDSLVDWTKRSSKDFRDANALSDVGATMQPTDLAEARLNQFIFTSAQTDYLSQILSITGTVGLRLEGPASGGDNLFTWDAGVPDPAVKTQPVLRMVIVPADFTFVTVTPTPQNVLTAAAMAVRNTQVAQQNGTPTLFPRNYATAFPFMPITPQPTPANQETVTMQNMVATAIAMTTGTFTPTPNYWVTTTPLPPVIPAQMLTPTPTSSPTPTPLTMLQTAQRTIPSSLYNKIIFQRGTRNAPQIWVMDPDGKNLGLVTDRAIFETVMARDAMSPDGVYYLFNAPDKDRPEILQIYRWDLRQPLGEPTLLTILRNGLAFAPTWSPDGARIAYTSTESGKQEIWVMNVNATPRAPRPITNSTDWFWSQSSSWSPDGKQIVYATDRGHTGSFTEIWIMNTDGSGARSLGDGQTDAWNPVWIKWNR